MFLFCSLGCGGAPEGAKTMRWRDHLYPVAIEQALDVASLAKLSDTAADEADESGDLAGNRMYQDLRGYGWPDVARALALEPDSDTSGG
jgi:hypothetical protein